MEEHSIFVIFHIIYEPTSLQLDKIEYLVTVHGNNVSMNVRNCYKLKKKLNEYIYLVYIIYYSSVKKNIYALQVFWVFITQLFTSN